MTSEKFDTQWYYDAVISGIILKGYSSAVAKKIVENYKLKERLELFPEAQMHYSIDATIEEAFELNK